MSVSFGIEMRVETKKSANKLTFYPEFCTFHVFVIGAQLVLQQNCGKSWKQVFLLLREHENIHAWGVWNTFVCHQPVFLLRRRQVRTGRGTVMFIWETSNNRRLAKLKTRLLLAARLFNANCILSRLESTLLHHTCETNKLFISTICISRVFSAILVSNNRWSQ